MQLINPLTLLALQAGIISEIAASPLPSPSPSSVHLPHVPGTPPHRLAVHNTTFVPPKILSISFSGNGCPQGTTEPDFASPFVWEHLRVKLNEFSVRAGINAGIAERTANCQAHLSLDGSGAPGWQFALKSLRSMGQWETEGPGVTLTQFVTAYFSASAADTITTVQTVTSPEDGNSDSRYLNLVALIPDETLLWSPCGSSSILNVNFRMALTMKYDGSWGLYGVQEHGPNEPVREQLGWTWRRC